MERVARYADHASGRQGFRPYLQWLAGRWIAPTVHPLATESPVVLKARILAAVQSRATNDLHPTIIARTESFWVGERTHKTKRGQPRRRPFVVFSVAVRVPRLPRKATPSIQSNHMVIPDIIAEHHSMQCQHLWMGRHLQHTVIVS
jgi:hypothetical protein